MIEYSKLSVIIVSWNRLKNLARTAWSLAEALPNYRAMFVISNHPYGLGPSGFCYENLQATLPDMGWPKPDKAMWTRMFNPPPRCLPIQTGRPFEHGGNLAQSWNLGMLWAFRDPEVEWVLCSQDDVAILPGFHRLFEEHDFDLYSAPVGDTIFLFNRTCLRKVGWFDERYTVIGCHELDWQARTILAVGRNRVCLEDFGHGFTVNPIGLSGFWQVADPEFGKKSSIGWEGTIQYMKDKWGEDLVFPMRRVAIGRPLPAPRIPEYDWYPWFNRQALASPTIAGRIA